MPDVSDMCDDDLRQELKRRQDAREAAEAEWQRELYVLVDNALANPELRKIITAAARRSLRNSDYALWVNSPEKFDVNFGFYYHG